MMPIGERLARELEQVHLDTVRFLSVVIGHGGIEMLPGNAEVHPSPPLMMPEGAVTTRMNRDPGH